MAREQVREEKPEPRTSGALPVKKEISGGVQRAAPLPKKEQAPPTVKVKLAQKEPSPRYVVPRGPPASTPEVKGKREEAAEREARKREERVASLPPSPKAEAALPPIKEPSPRLVVPKGSPAPTPEVKEKRKEAAERKARKQEERVASLPPFPKAEAALPPIKEGEVIEAIDAAVKALYKAKTRGGEREDPEAFRSAQGSLEKAKDAFRGGRLEEGFLNAFLALERAQRLAVRARRTSPPGSRGALKKVAFEAILKADRALGDARRRGPYGEKKGHTYNQARTLLRRAVKSYTGGHFKKAQEDAELAEKQALSLIP